MATHPTIGVVMAALAGYYWGGILAGMQRVARQHSARLIVIQGTPQDVQLHGLASDILFVGWLDNSSIQQRFEGYCDALAEHGIPFDPGMVIHIDENWDYSGRSTADRAWHAMPSDRRRH